MRTLGSLELGFSKEGGSSGDLSVLVESLLKILPDKVILFILCYLQPLIR